MTLDELARKGYVIEDWKRWQQGRCGGYAVALIRTFPHLRLGGIDFYDGMGINHYLAHDDEYAYDSAGRHLIASGRHLIDPDAEWFPDLGDPRDYALHEDYGDCGDYDDAELADVLAHAMRHNILPLEVKHDATV